jgi:hypothetical protein
MHLSADQIHGFIHDGFVVARGLLPSDLVKETRERLLAAVAAEPEPGEVLWQSHLRALTWPCWTPEVLAVGEQLVGPHYRRGENYSPFLESKGECGYFTGYVPVLRYPKPGSKEFTPPTGGWHVDGYRGVSLYPELLFLVVFAYLSDVTEYGGATVVRPGSHRQLFEHWYRHGGVHDHVLPDLDWPEPVPVPGKAGDVIFMHYLMTHAGSTNHDDRIRVALNSAIEPDPAHPYVPKIGPPAADWTPMDYALRTDTLRG